jgi:hypothetical protein
LKDLIEISNFLTARLIGGQSQIFKARLKLIWTAVIFVLAACKKPEAVNVRESRFILAISFVRAPLF